MSITIPMDGKIIFDGGRQAECLRVLTTGDLAFGGLSEKLLLEGQGDRVFAPMIPELLDKDLSVTNLETVLANCGSPIYKCGPNLRSSPRMLPAIAQAGFDVFCLANNHTRDFGDDAFMEMLGHIRAAGKHYVGGGADLNEATRPLRLEIKGLKLSIFAATMHNICQAGVRSPGANPLAPVPLAAAIAREKNAGRLVLAFIHDGKEHLPFPSPRVRENCRGFIDAGAAAVICHHPHIAQGFELYNSGLIAYSLGNFLFYHRTPDNSPDFWWKSYALRLHLDRDGISAVDVIPHELSRDGILSPMSGETRRAFLEKLSRLNRILADDELCDRYYHAAAMKNVYYEQRISNLMDLRKNGKTDCHEHFESMFFCNHILCTEEHMDVLQSISGGKCADNVPAPPHDLEYFLT